MAFVTDPDDLAQATEVVINTAARTVQLLAAGSLADPGTQAADNGVTGQALYSFLKEEWKDDPLLIPFPFPMVAITSEQFEFVEGWRPADDTTRRFIRTAGWREVDATDTLNREYSGIVSLGNIDAGDTPYFAFAGAASATNFNFDGVVNEAIQTFGDADNGNFDSRATVLTVYIRVQGKTYDQATTTDIGVAILTNQAFRFPLNEANDLNITQSDVFIDANAPYTGMGIEFFGAAQSRNIGGSPFDFHVIITGNNGTAEQIYEFVQRELRRTTDIDDGGGTVIGQLADSLLLFVGSTLRTIDIDPADNADGGTYIDGFNANDTNRLIFVDDTGADRTFPFVAAGNINFNPNLVANQGAIDPTANFWMFFDRTRRTTTTDLVISGAAGAAATLSSAGSELPDLAVNDYVRISGSANPVNNGIWQVTTETTPTSSWDATKVDGATVIDETAFSATVDENPIDSPGAIIVDDNGGSDITGDISSGSVAFDFDYDNNSQGGRSSGTDADIVLRAIGLDAAQFVQATGQITRATGLSFSLVAGLERNYSNP